MNIAGPRGTRARIVFDLDGTLIDSAPDIHGIANRVLAGEGCPPITLDQTRDFIGNGASVFVARMRKTALIADSEHDRLLAKFIAAYHSAVQLTHTYPRVVDTLKQLAAAGHSLAVCTNKPIAPTRSVLGHFGIDTLFMAVIGGDSLPVSKPDPAPLRAAFDALPPGPEIYVGDSGVDAETAAQARVPFLLFTEGYRKHPVAALPHTASFSSFADLPMAIDAVLATAA